MSCCNLFSVCLLLVVAVVLTAIMLILLCSLQVGTIEDGSVSLEVLPVVFLLVLCGFSLGLVFL